MPPHVWSRPEAHRELASGQGARVLSLAGVDLATAEIRTDRLLLRPPRPEDEDAVLRACQDPEVLRWTARLPDPYTRADAAEWVREIAPAERAGGHGLPCVVEADGALVGSCGLTVLDPRSGADAEVGYWTAAWARRRGHATAATRALTGWAFDHGAGRVRLLTLLGNDASQEVARRAGFRAEGVLRGGITRLDGSRCDAALFVRDA
jgi:RimJ/RimL family protein N-acetyltransferase